MKNRLINKLKFYNKLIFKLYEKLPNPNFKLLVRIYKISKWLFLIHKLIKQIFSLVNLILIRINHKLIIYFKDILFYLFKYNFKKNIKINLILLNLNQLKKSKITQDYIENIENDFEILKNFNIL